uniref:FAD-binding PCMH-type domain-containing protein n=1 Tax=Chenopodium quinoa TaxID=63459 RepID=A0A803M237_CHEQI
MMNLNRVIVDLESESAWVEGGATLGELYSAIAAHSSYYGFPAGLGPTVGVSGHFSGGGIGVLGRKYGLSADNMLDVGLIDAEGRVMGRAEMGEEIFWALRGGGGGNFGVVYGWKVQLVHVPKGTSKQVYVTFKGLYLGSRLEAMSNVNQRYLELEISEEEYLEMSWIESVLYFSGLPKGKGALEMVAIEPMGLLLLDPYGEEDDENRILSWIRKVYDYMTPFVASNPRAAYVNYIDLDLGTIDFTDKDEDTDKKARVWGEKYFLGNYDRLVKVKTIIDQQNVFNHIQGIPSSSVQYHDEL